MWSCFIHYILMERYPRLCRFPLFVYNDFTLSLPLSLSLSPKNSDLHLAYYAEFVCCEVLESNSFVLKTYFILPQLFEFLFEVLSVTAFVIRERFVKKKKKKKGYLCSNLYPCEIKYYPLSLSLSL